MDTTTKVLAWIITIFSGFYLLGGILLIITNAMDGWTLMALVYAIIVMIFSIRILQNKNK